MRGKSNNPNYLHFPQMGLLFVPSQKPHSLRDFALFYSSLKADPHLQTCVTRYRSFFVRHGTCVHAHITCIRICNTCGCVNTVVEASLPAPYVGHTSATANAFLRGLKSFISYKWGLSLRRCPLTSQ